MISGAGSWFSARTSFLVEDDVWTAEILMNVYAQDGLRFHGRDNISAPLTAHSRWEGYRVAVNGTYSWPELDVTERSSVPPCSSHQTVGSGRVVVDARGQLSSRLEGLRSSLATAPGTKGLRTDQAVKLDSHGIGPLSAEEEAQDESYRSC